VDLAKSVFEVAVSRRAGQVERRRRLSRGQFSRFLTEQAPATVVMEACGTAHFWGREAGSLGHRVVLIPPHAVRPYALRNEDVRPVPVKSVDQQVLASLHRMRSAWMATRTARLNLLRGLLRELGFAIPLGAREVVPRVMALVSEADSGRPEALRGSLTEVAGEIGELEMRVRPRRIDCAPGRSHARKPAGTTRPPSRWPTSWPGSPGPCGATDEPSAASTPEERGGIPPQRLLRAHDGDAAPVLTGAGTSR
jgi:hypothetical protein